MGYVGIGDASSPPMLNLTQIRKLAENIFAWQHNWGDVRQAMVAVPKVQRRVLYAELTTVAKAKWGPLSSKVTTLINKIKSEFPMQITGSAAPPTPAPKPSAPSGGILKSILSAAPSYLPRGGGSSFQPGQSMSSSAAETAYTGGSGGGWGWGGSASEDILETRTDSSSSALTSGNRFSGSKAPTASGGKSSLLPWIIGGVAVAGVIYFATRK
jgi:hypothetical protein